MSKEVSIDEINSIIDRWGQCRREFIEFIYRVGPNAYLTWTEMGSDIRHVYEKYGEWMLNKELQDRFRDFDDFFWSDADNRLIPIMDVILHRIEFEDGIINKEAFAKVLTSKVVKSIAYGATWPQMRIFINKEIDRACGVDNEKR